MIRQVRKGEVMEDGLAPVFADRDGWIWYDETGGLGMSVIHPDRESAEFARHEYITYFLKQDLPPQLDTQ